jgi:nitrate/nitrite-specific signal transduction histidine kinase
MPVFPPDKISTSELDSLVAYVTSLGGGHAHDRPVDLGADLQMHHWMALFTVEDDGRGFDPEHLARGHWPHLGLQSMQERAAAIGARFTLDTALERGTRIIIDLPLKGAHPL